ncbi:hypothetical protein M422DRAFT_27548 [Sphaerobolus stellatus SS14]|nr:hypothetical protein M422DRAFT_27548 [Sphaerobolus stellatus SS14]
MALKTSSASTTTPSKDGSRKSTLSKVSSTIQDRPFSPTELLSPPVSPLVFGRDGSEAEASWRKKNSLQSDALRRHFAQMYEPRQLQEVNDALEMGWNCSICMDTAEEPCVTRCGHMYCRSHITESLQKNRSCPVCNAPCTLSRDIVPVFARETLSPLESPSSSPRSASPTFSPEFPHISTDGYFSLTSRGRPRARVRSSTRSEPVSYPMVQSAQPSATSTSNFAHYIGITFRVLGLALILGALLRSGSTASITHQSDL